MRFCKYWAIGAIVITLLSACSDFRQGNSPSSTSKDFTLHAVSGSEHLTNRNIELITSVYGISSQASTETGLYEIVPSGTKGSNIIYTDFDSKTRTYLCNRPECLHKDENCPSWIASDSCLIFTGGTGHNIFILQLETYNSPYTGIWKAEPNGNNRNLLFQFQPNQNIVNGIAADEEYLYITVQEVDSITYQPKKCVRQVKMLAKGPQKG